MCEDSEITRKCENYSRLFPMAGICVAVAMRIGYHVFKEILLAKIKFIESRSVNLRQPQFRLQLV